MCFRGVRCSVRSQSVSCSALEGFQGFQGFSACGVAGFRGGVRICAFWCSCLWYENEGFEV